MSHRFRANEVRLQLTVLAYNLGNLWRRRPVARATLRRSFDGPSRFWLAAGVRPMVPVNRCFVRSCLPNRTTTCRGNPGWTLRTKTLSYWNGL